MRNTLISAIAFTILIIGIVLLISPIPIGIFVIGFSLAVLVSVNTTVRAWVKYLRTRYRWLNTKVKKLESALESKFRILWQALLYTRPDELKTPEKRDPSRDQD